MNADNGKARILRGIELSRLRAVWFGVILATAALTIFVSARPLLDCTASYSAPRTGIALFGAKGAAKQLLFAFGDEPRKREPIPGGRRNRIKDPSRTRVAEGFPNW